MKILLLGGTGAMGASLSEILSSQGHQINITSRKERTSLRDNIEYIVGNAHDDSFLDSLLINEFDAIVDFMVYTTEEFRNRYKKLLSTTGHYIFLSSSRVYAENNEDKITESSPRLLDVCRDEKYLASDEYALTKARQEDLLQKCDYKNYTIIRPYITYNSNRLQLGTLEKEYWLQRALQKKTVIFQKEISECVTTLTYGHDVALAMSILIGNENAYGETYHITGEESLLWGDVLRIYERILRENGLDIKIQMEDTTDNVARLFGNYYQIHYDRLYNRRFDNSKIIGLCGGALKFTSVNEGIKQALERFLQKPQFLTNNLLWEAHCDGLTGEKRTIKVKGAKDKVRYFIFRNMPELGKRVKKIEL